MKIFTSVFALLVGGALMTPAYAECPNGQFAFYTEGDDNGTPIAVEHCRETLDEGGDVAWTGDPSDGLHITPVDDPENPGQQLVIDGKPIVSGGSANDTNHQDDYNDPEVYGMKGVAVGHNAMVGQFVEQVGTGPSCPNGGVLTGDSCIVDGPDGVQDGIPDGGADYDATPASDDFVPAHAEFVDNGTALGANTSVQHNNSTALGAGATSTDDHQVTLGTSEETIKAPGITSQKSKDRQTEGAIELVTTDQAGHLASDGGATFAAIQDNTNQLNLHETALASHDVAIGRLTQDVDRAFEGVAMALAMETPDLDPGKTFGVSLNWGNFEGENALAGAFKLRFDDTWSFGGGVGYGLSSNTVGGKAGIQAQW